MTADWTTSPTGSRVLQHHADPRPAWLWSQDGTQLLWHNDAAKLFLAKLKKSGLKLAAPAVPIKGQVARNIRLGSVGRTSLARIQFLAGSKPTSSTCATTPLHWRDGQMALLIVGVDPIDADIRTAAQAPDDDTAEPNAAIAEAVGGEGVPEATADTVEIATAEPLLEATIEPSEELPEEPSAPTQDTSAEPTQDASAEPTENSSA